MFIADGLALPGATVIDEIWHNYVPAGTATERASLNDSEVEGDVVMASDSFMEDEVRKIDSHFGCQSASVNMGSWLRLNGRQSKTKHNKQTCSDAPSARRGRSPPAVREGEPHCRGQSVLDTTSAAARLVNWWVLTHLFIVLWWELKIVELSGVVLGQ